jgi:asparagine synthase (glutamine-hydrolysing)
MRVDKMTMATSVEARVPFLDHKLIEFASAIPAQLKYKRGQTKYILRAALEGVIPEQVLRRPKVGFGAPISEWMLDALGSYVEAALFNSPLRKRGLFDYDFISLLLSRHRAGKGDFSFLLWSLLNLTLWYERWIDNAPSRVQPPCDRRAGLEEAAGVPGMTGALNGSSRSIQL